MARYFFRLGRRKIAYFVVPSLVISAIFIIYQFLLFCRFLSNESDLSHDKSVSLIRGIHQQELPFYTSNDGKFTCIKSMEVITLSKVNDDYCDCLDGTDEPGTNACPNGVFYCSKLSREIRYPKSVPSSKVNDGICDCCDGSDEYLQNQIIQSIEKAVQEKTGHFLVPCPNVCS